MTTSLIQAGSAVPAIAVKENEANVANPLPLTGKNIIVGQPGAFSGACNAQVPGYIKNYEKFQAKGINAIYVVAVNDVFVMKAWKEHLAPEGTPVHFISDDQGKFVASLGLSFDATSLLGTLRAKRFALVTEGEKVVSVAVEDVPSQLTVTNAEAILEQL